MTGKIKTIIDNLVWGYNANLVEATGERKARAKRKLALTLSSFTGIPLLGAVAIFVLPTVSQSETMAAAMVMMGWVYIGGSVVLGLQTLALKATDFGTERAVDTSTYSTLV